MLNGNPQKIASKILQQFKTNFNINHLYQHCYRIYKHQQAQLSHKYSNLFGYLHLIKTRTIQTEKEDKFIKEWHAKLGKNGGFVVGRHHIQELIRVLEMLENKKQQILLFVQFLKDITREDWAQLEERLVEKISRFTDKIESALNNLLKKEKKSMKKEWKGKLNIVYELEKGKPIPLKEKEARAPVDIPDSKVDFRNSIFMNQCKSSSFSCCPYTAEAIKFSVKEKPSAIRLLTEEQIENIRRSFFLKRQSIGLNFTESLKESNKNTEYRNAKGKNQNFMTLQTEISEEENDHLSSKIMTESNQTTPEENDNGDEPIEQIKSKKVPNRQHKSTFVDPKQMARLLAFKDQKQKFNSIHKIEGITSPKNYKSKNNYEAPSRYTIQSGSMTRLKSMDTSLGFQPSIKKSRMSKVSLSGKLMKDYSKMQSVSRLRDHKKPRGGIFLAKQRLKDIEQTVQSLANQSHSSSSQEKDSDSNDSPDSSSENEVPIIQKEDKNDMMSLKTFKDNKFKRRFGVSTKGIKSVKSIDSYANQRGRGMKSSKLSNVGSRTSFFRSSGFALGDDKKSINKSKYSYKDGKKLRFQQSEVQIDDEVNDRPQDRPKSKFARQSNQKIEGEQNIYPINRKQVVSGKQMRMVLTEIQNQDRQDRSQNFEGYYTQLLRRKYEISAHSTEDNEEIRRPNYFKIERIEAVPRKVHINSSTDSKLFDFMNRNIRQYEQDVLIQCSISPQAE